MAPITNNDRKKVTLSLEKKVQLLKDVDSKSMPHVKIAEKYGVSKSTVSVMIKNRKQIEEAVQSCSFQLGRKRMRTSKNKKVDDALFTWFKQVRAVQTPVSGAVMMKAADQLATELKDDSFTPTTGWLDRFKKRKGIVFKTVSGEAASVDSTTTNNWRNDVLEKLIAEYSPENVFNADETGMFFKCLPDKTLALKGEECKGGKKSKDRLTALVAANMTGSEKLPLLIIGKVLKPCCSKHVKSLPLEYTANTKAWMTSKIFEDWLRKLDRKFHIQGRQILLFVDNCPAHPEVNNLKAIKLVFFPPNTTSVLQPCDQGIILTLKKYYRKLVLQKYLLHVNESRSPQDFNISILEALYMMRAAWNNVTGNTITNCFIHAGFINTPTNTDAKDDNLQVDNDMQNLFDNLKDIIPVDSTVNDFCEVDKHVLSCKEATLKDIAQEIIGATDADLEMDDEEEETVDEEEAPVSSYVAREALHALTKYFQQQEEGNEWSDAIGQLEMRLTKHLMEKTQTKISDYFTKTPHTMT